MKKLLLLAAFLCTLFGNAQTLDFEFSDINGGTHNISNDLAQGQTVVVVCFTTWSIEAWDYWQTNQLQQLNNSLPGIFSVYALESDPSTDLMDIYGVGTNTLGNWVGDSLNFTITEDLTLLDWFLPQYYPQVYVLCPNGNVTTTASNWPGVQDFYNAYLECQNGAPTYNDLAISYFDVNASCGLASIETTIYNGGDSTYTEIPVHFEINGVAYDYVWTGVLNPYNAVTFVLSDLDLGDYAYITVTLPEDSYLYNNTGATTYSYVAPFVSTSHVQLNLTTDEYPQDVTWSITDEFGNVVTAGGPYYDAFTNIIVDTYLATTGCYVLHIYDDSNNGIDTEELITFSSVDDWGNGAIFNYDGTYEYGEIQVPFVVQEVVPYALTGYVFNDSNYNGLFDLGEQGIGGVTVQLDNMVTVSNENGGYAFNDVSGVFGSLSINYDANAWPLATTPTAYNNIVSNQSYNFGLTTSTYYYQTDAFVVGTEYLICNTENMLTGGVMNNSNAAVNITATAYVDPNIIILDYNIPGLTVDGNTVTWTDSLGAGEWAYIQIPVLAPGEDLIGFDMSFSLHVVATDLQGNVVSISDANSTMPFFCSFDPNAIDVNPKGETDEHFITADQRLEYTVYFQNIGNYPAQDVIITDVLDSHLDPQTFEYMSASADNQVSFDAATGNLVFTFHDIYLPDSTTNEAMSHGFVKFSIKPYADVAEGTVINNQASIVFDSNSPVITNTVFNTVNDLYFGIEENKVTTLTAYPNPTEGIITIQFGDMQGMKNVKVTDITGRIVMTNMVSSSQMTLDLGSISSGMYIISATDKNGFTVKTTIRKN